MRDWKRWPLISGRTAFRVAILLVFVFKCWVVHREEIYGLTAEHDELWYLNSARAWYWNADYSWTAFYRPAAYPLWVASVHKIGLPLRIATDLLQIGGFALIALALRYANVSRPVVWLFFALATLNPATFVLNNYSRADAFYAGAMAWFIGGLIVLLGRPSVGAASVSALACAALWHAREESMLLPPLVISYVLAAYVLRRARTNDWQRALRGLGAPAVVFVVLAIALVAAINTANYRRFGGFAKSEMTSPDYAAAYRALLRIRPARVDRFVPVSREAIEKAFGVSPTFARLRRAYEGPVGQLWQSPTEYTTNLPGEIPAGWTRFALRSMAASIGVHRDPERARKFYRRVAREINRACDEGKIPSRVVLSDFLDPGTMHFLRYVPESFARVVSVLFHQYAVTIDREDAVMEPRFRDLYDEMALRRTALSRIGQLRLIGWAFQVGDPVEFVGYDAIRGEIEAGTTHLGPLASAAPAAAGEGDVPEKVQFVLSIELRHGAGPAGDLLFITRSGARYRAPVESVFRGDALLRETGEGPPLQYAIAARDFSPSREAASLAVENFIGKHYRYLMMIFSVAAAIAACVL
ncbi:MAG TPA: hypothetical protein VF683_00820, partial [Chthoniobacterales bacterium]